MCKLTLGRHSCAEAAPAGLLFRRPAVSAWFRALRGCTELGVLAFPLFVLLESLCGQEELFVLSERASLLAGFAGG